MEKDLYGKTFYACFVNGDERDDKYPFYFHNEYELVDVSMVDSSLKEGKELYNKLDFFIRQQIYYAVVRISGHREARKIGEYKKWYKLTFAQKGKYSCKVYELTSATETFFKEDEYRCDIACISKQENHSLIELYNVHADGKHIHEGKKEKTTISGMGTLHVGMNVDAIDVWRCILPYYLCVEFIDCNGLPIGLFDMAYTPFVFQNYSDQNIPPGGNWNGRIPITVFISHFHYDHYSGLLRMINEHNAGGPRTYNYFFSNMDLHIPDTFQPISFGTITATIAGAGGNVTIHNDAVPFSAPNAAFDYGLGQFNHPITGNYVPHPHLHGMYVQCTTTGGTRVLIAGDTVYRGIGSLAGPMPRMGELAGPYDVLIACHHGGNYAVSIAGHNLPAGVNREDYIPVPAANNPIVIYSSNGNGGGFHPAPAVIQDHLGQGWGSCMITNANYNSFGVIPPTVTIYPACGVEIT